MFEFNHEENNAFDPYSDEVSAFVNDNYILLADYFHTQIKEGVIEEVKFLYPYLMNANDHDIHKYFQVFFSSVEACHDKILADKFVLIAQYFYQQSEAYYYDFFKNTAEIDRWNPSCPSILHKLFANNRFELFFLFIEHGAQIVNKDSLKLYTTKWTVDYHNVVVEFMRIPSAALIAALAHYGFAMMDCTGFVKAKDDASDLEEQFWLKEFIGDNPTPASIALKFAQSVHGYFLDLSIKEFIEQMSQGYLFATVVLFFEFIPLKSMVARTSDKTPWHLCTDEEETEDIKVCLKKGKKSRLLLTLAMNNALHDTSMFLLQVFANMFLTETLPAQKRIMDSLASSTVLNEIFPRVMALRF